LRLISDPNLKLGGPRDQDDSAPQSGWHHAALRVFAGSPEDLAGTVYGTIVVLAVIAAGSAPAEVEAWPLVALVVSTTLVLWAGHVYAHGLAESVRLGRRLDVTELRVLARREAAIPLAALAPSVALCLGALELIREGAAVWLALGLGVTILGVEGLRYARLEDLGHARTLLTIGVNIMLGVTIVVIKIAVTY
jgi:hypothetical protein